MTLVGYARVSSVGQSLEVQLDKLKHCKKIYQEKKSAIAHCCITPYSVAFSKNQATFLDIGSPKVVNLFKIDVAITASFFCRLISLECIFGPIIFLYLCMESSA